MKTEIRYNGSTQLRMKGERPIETVAISELLSACEKGQRLTVSEGDPGELVIALENAHA